MNGYSDEVNEYSDENNEYEDNENYDNESNDEESEEINENLEDIIGSYNKDEISLESLEGITQELREEISNRKNVLLPPVEQEIEEINEYIEKKKQDLEKAKKASVFIDDVSDDIEFHYSDHKSKHVEDEIKEQLNKRYTQEKIKFKLMEELEELESRESVCTRLLESYDLRERMNDVLSYAEEISADLGFDIENYYSITAFEDDSIDTWENNWSTILEVLGKSSHYQNQMQKLSEFFDDIKKQLEEKDPETKFVFDELPKYAEFEPALQELTSNYEEILFSSMAALYEITSNYEVGEDYLPENRPYAIGKINRLKIMITSMRTTMDNYKLDYKDFRKSLNNIFVLLNKAAQNIESQQKILKSQQEARTKKIRDIYTTISRSNLETLRQMTNDLNNAINSLTNAGASSFVVEALQYYFSLKAKYPVDESAREEIIDGLNSEITSLNIMEIDPMCKILEAKYEPKRGIYIENTGATNIRPAQNQPVRTQQAQPQNDEQVGTAGLAPKGKTGNLDFLGNMYMKEAQRSKGQWAAKSYLKAIEAYMKCAEIEDDMTKKLTFLKLALKAAKDAVMEKEDASTLYAYANSYRELAYNHSSKVSPQSQIKVGDNFVNAAKHFIREENIVSAKSAFNEAYEAYKRSPDDDTIRLRMESVKKFIK